MAGKCCTGLPTEGPAKPSSCGVPRHKGCCPVRRHWSIARTFREGKKTLQTQPGRVQEGRAYRLSICWVEKSLCFSAWLLREKKVATHGASVVEREEAPVLTRKKYKTEQAHLGANAAVSCHDTALCSSLLRSGVLNISNKFETEFRDESQPNTGWHWRHCGLMEPWIRNPAWIRLCGCVGI